MDLNGFVVLQLRVSLASCKLNFSSSAFTKSNITQLSLFATSNIARRHEVHGSGSRYLLCARVMYPSCATVHKQFLLHVSCSLGLAALVSLRDLAAPASLATFKELSGIAEEIEML